MIKVLLFHDDNDKDRGDNDNDKDNNNISGNDKYNDNNYPCCRVAAAACPRCPRALQARTSHVQLFWKTS